MVKLLVVGATGLIGKKVIEQALADERITHVVALTRRPIGPAPKLENVVTEFSEISDQARYWSVDGVVSALGTTRASTKSPLAYRAIEYNFPLAIARHARNHGASSFALTSALGADPKSTFTYTRTKGELEVELVKLGFPSLTIVRPSVLDGDRERPRKDEHAARIIAKMLAPLLPRRLRISPAGGIATLLINGAVEAPPGVHVQTNEDIG